MIFEKMTSRETRNTAQCLELSKLHVYVCSVFKRKSVYVFSLWMDYFSCIRHYIYIKRWKWPFVITAKADEIKSTHD
jgi:hypothetical protein